MLPKSVSGQTSACPPRSVVVAAPQLGAPPQIDVKMGDAKRQLPQSGNAPKRSKSVEKEYILVPGASAAAAAAGGLSTSSPPSPGSGGVPVSTGGGTAPQLGPGAKDSGFSKPAVSASDAAGAICLLRAGAGSSEHVARFTYRKQFTPWVGGYPQTVPTLGSSVPGLLFSAAQNINLNPGTRLGNAVRIKRIVLKIRVACSNRATAGAPAVYGEFIQLPRFRVIVLVDRMAELGAFAWCELQAPPPLQFNGLMWSPTANGTSQTNNNTTLRWNPNTFGYRFIKMHDEVYKVSDMSEHSGQSQLVAGGTQVKNMVKHVEIDLDFHMMQQLYQGAAATDFVNNTPYWHIIRDVMPNEDAANVIQYLYDFEIYAEYEDVENAAPDG